MMAAPRKRKPPTDRGDAEHYACSCSATAHEWAYDPELGDYRAACTPCAARLATDTPSKSDDDEG